MFEVVLGLGSNVGNRAVQLRAAVAALDECLEDIHVSNFFETTALLNPGSPAEWNMPFYNIVVTGITYHSPQDLLSVVKNIEKRMGRTDRGHWAPREIDIDILAMGEVVIEAPTLCVPHKELLNRDFFLLPLAQVAPEWIFPASGKYHGWTAAKIAADKGFVLNNSIRDTGTRVYV